MTVRGRHEGRTGADAAVLAALAGGATAAEAASAGHVSERTVRRRLAEPDFARKVEAARSEIVATAVSRISSGSMAAVDAILTLLSPEQPPSVRLAAGKTVLEYGMKFRAEREFADRLEAIEEHLGNTKGEQA